MGKYHEMTKPDGIPQDVWYAAHQFHFDEGMRTAGKPDVPLTIARAIMAEREASAQVAQGIAEETWSQPCHAIATAIAAAIRNRGA